MKTKHLILLEAGAIVAGLVAWIAYNTRGIMPEIAGKILLAALILAGLAALWIASTLIRRIYANVHDMLMRRQDRREREYDLRAREIELQERQVQVQGVKQSLAIEFEQHEIHKQATLAEIHMKLSRLYADPNGNYPVIIPGRIDLLPSQMAGNILALPAGQLRGVKQRELPEQADSLQDETSVPTAPTFQAMRHLIRGSELPLCYGQRGAILGTVDDLLSMAVTGKPGRGKTTALMYYVAILLACGAEVVIWDPHGAMADLAKLNNQRLPNMPETARVYYFDRKEDIIASLPMLEQNLQHRDDYYRRTRQTMHPHLLLADELPVLADYDEELARGTRRGEEAPSLIKVIRRYVLEARKWRCYFIGSGQSMDAEILPTRVTENLSSRIVFFSSDRRARMAGLENDAIKKYLPIIRRAGSGVMVFDCARFDEPVLGAIPLITIEDLMEFLGLSVPSGLIEMERLQPRDVSRTFWTPVLSSAEGRNQGVRDVQTGSLERDSDGEIETPANVRAFPQRTSNQPGEQSDVTTEERPKEYRLSEAEIQQFIAAYKVSGSIDKSLAAIGRGGWYKRHASEIVRAYGLRQNA